MDEEEYEYGIMEVMEPSKEVVEDSIDEDQTGYSDVDADTGEEIAVGEKEKKQSSTEGGYTADPMGRVFTKFDELHRGSDQVKNMPGVGVGYQTEVRKAQIILKNEEMGMYDGPGKKNTKRREDPMFKSLNLILFAARGKVIYVELKNDTEVSGRLEEVDTAMNLVLTSESADGFENETYVKGDTVRYVRFQRGFKISQDLKVRKISTSSLEGYISIFYLSQSVLSGALENPYLLLFHPTVVLASHNTIILIITHLSTRKSIYQHR